MDRDEVRRRCDAVRAAAARMRADAGLTLRDDRRMRASNAVLWRDNREAVKRQRGDTPRPDPESR